MRKSRRFSTHRMEIWPAYVDAFSSLVMVVVLILIILVISQFLLSDALNKRTTAFGELSHKLNMLSAALKGESEAKDSLAKKLSQREEALAKRESELNLLTQERQGTLATLSEREKELADQKTKQLEIEAKIDELLQQMNGLTQALNVAETSVAAKEVEISQLTTRLNQAMASKVEELAQYRSEFLGRLRKTLGERPNIRIVGDRFVFQSEVLFTSGSAELQDSGKQELARLADDLKTIASSIPQDLDWVLEVQGHTDRRPIRSPVFKSNWELSLARALSVVRFLIERGIPATRLAASGYAEFQPLDAGKTESAYAKNRRIELKLSQKTSSNKSAIPSPSATTAQLP